MFRSNEAQKSLKWRIKRRKGVLIIIVIAVLIVGTVILANSLRFGTSHPVTSTQTTSKACPTNASSCTVTYVTSSSPNSSQWLIVRSNSLPFSVSANNTGPIPEYNTLSSLNQTKIGVYCVSVSQSGSCASFRQYLQTGWFWDSANQILYIHYVGGQDVKLSIVAKES